MEPKKPPQSGPHPATQTMRTERPEWASDDASEVVERRPGAFEDDDTFLDGGPSGRRPITEEMSLLDVDDARHSSEDAPVDPALAEFGDGAVLEHAHAPITEILDGPLSSQDAVSARSREGPAPPRTRIDSRERALPLDDIQEARRLLEEAEGLLRAARTQVHADLDDGPRLKEALEPILKRVSEALSKLPR